MGKINSCLKCLFIFFNIVFAILGCLLIFGAVQATAYSHQLSAMGSPGRGWVWVFALGVLGISCLGIFAGFSEKPLALKIFAGFMVVGMIVMLIFGIIIVVFRNKVREGLYSGALVQVYMHDPEAREMLEELQKTEHCCGIVSSSDWGHDIPPSCECQDSYRRHDDYQGLFGSGSCVARPPGTSGPDQIYDTSCDASIMRWFDIICNVMMGFFFGCAVVALLGLLLTLLMLHQVNRSEDTSSMAMRGY